MVIFLVTLFSVWCIGPQPIPRMHEIRRPSLALFKKGYNTNLFDDGDKKFVYMDKNQLTVLTSHRTCAEHLELFHHRCTTNEIQIWLLLCGSLENPHLGGVYGGATYFGKYNGTTIAEAHELKKLDTFAFYKKYGIHLWHAGKPGFMTVVEKMLSLGENIGEKLGSILYDHTSTFGNYMPTQNVDWRYIVFLRKAPYGHILPGKQKLFNRIFYPYSSNKRTSWDLYIRLLFSNVNTEIFGDINRYSNMGSVTWNNYISIDFTADFVPFKSNDTKDFMACDSTPVYKEGPFQALNDYEIRSFEFPYGIRAVTQIVQSADNFIKMRQSCTSTENKFTPKYVTECGAYLVDTTKIACRKWQFYGDEQRQRITIPDDDMTDDQLRHELSPRSTFCKGFSFVKHNDDFLLLSTSLGRCGGMWNFGTYTQQIMNSLIENYYPLKDSTYCHESGFDTTDFAIPSRSLPLFLEKSQSSYFVYVSGTRTTQTALTLITHLAHGVPISNATDMQNNIGEDNVYFYANTTVIDVSGLIASTTHIQQYT